jgi:DNA (cytosine-5)-methyltransferase 1
MSAASKPGSRPRLLDLFCGAGGAARGYQQVGFYVIGVDIVEQPRYAGDEFHRTDAFSVLGAIINGREGPALSELDAIHASPPCQSYSRALRHRSLPQPELLDEVRDLAEQVGLPWIIENVLGAPLPNADTLDGRYGIELCGTQFGLLIARHCLFETSFPVVAPHRPCTHSDRNVLNPYNAKSRRRMIGDAKGDMAEIVWRSEMGVPWMNRYEGREAIPPAYTEFIGTQLMSYLMEPDWNEAVASYRADVGA